MSWENFDELRTGGLSGADGDGALRDAEMVSEGFEEGGVCSAIFRRCRHPDAETAVRQRFDAAALRSRNDADANPHFPLRD